MSEAVTVECTNANQIRLRVTAEMTIHEWEILLDHTTGVAYYRPLSELMRAIGKGIEAIRKREDVRFCDLPKEPSI